MRPSLMGHVPLQAGMFMTDGYKINPKMERKQNHKLDNQGWLGRPAAVVVKGANDIDFLGCRFEHLGSSGLDYEWGTRGGLIEGCLFRDIAGNGIVAEVSAPPPTRPICPTIPPMAARYARVSPSPTTSSPMSPTRTGALSASVPDM